VLNATYTTALIDFWAEICQPCQLVRAVLEELPDDYAGLVVGAIDAAAYPEVAAQFAVQSLPTLIFFRNGELVRRLVGGRPKRHIEKELQAVMQL
jgi:thioredoxin 1